MELPLTGPAADTVDLRKYVRPGDTILVGQATGEPRTLTEMLVRQRSTLGGVDVFLGAMFSETFRPEHADHLRFVGIGGMGSNALLTRAGVLDVLPCHISTLPSLLESRHLPVDVVFVQLAPAGPDANHSLGMVGDYLTPAIAQARTVIAEINDQVPCIIGEGAVPPDRIDARVYTSRPPVTVTARPATPRDRRIAALIEPLVADGAVIQLGVGSTPQAIAGGLLAKHDLSVHSGVVGDWIVDLHAAGVVTNTRKQIDTGVTITGGLFGTAKLFDFADRNPRIQLRPLTYTHDPGVLRHLKGLIAINSAVEVDLTGQVNAETVAGIHVGAVGGQVDFVRAAMASEGGRSIIVLPSTAAGGTKSRIVARLPDAVVTTARSDADIVVTEHGVADLRGLSLHRRADRLLSIADPAFRNALASQLRNRTLC